MKLIFAVFMCWKCWRPCRSPSIGSSAVSSGVGVPVSVAASIFTFDFNEAVVLEVMAAHRLDGIIETGWPGDLICWLALSGEAL